MGPADEAEVELAAGAFAALLTRHLPDFVHGLHLVGSAVDGDFRAGRSDLDFVAVVNRKPTADELEGLTIIHRLYGADPTLPKLDGIWITESDIAAGPDKAAAGPATLAGEFRARERGNRNPITWFTLRDRSRALLGTLDREQVWFDPGRLKSWTCQNVEQYWVPWFEQSSRWTTRRGLLMLGREAPAWGVLSISRLHATLAINAILSKSAAGEHARTAFSGEWHQIVDECLRIRRGEGGRMQPHARRRRALDFVAMVIEATRAYCASE